MDNTVLLHCQLCFTVNSALARGHKKQSTEGNQVAKQKQISVPECDKEAGD